MAIALKSFIAAISSFGVVVLGYGGYLLSTRKNSLEDRLLFSGMRLLDFKNTTENLDVENWKKKVEKYKTSTNLSKFVSLDLSAASSPASNEDIQKIKDACKKSIESNDPIENKYDQIKEWCAIENDLATTS